VQPIATTAAFTSTPAHGVAYYPHINLLRGFAALSVLVYHVIELGKWTNFPIDYGLRWFRSGWMAVDLFFVISGFVIAHSLLQWQAQGLPQKEILKRFFRRRFWRIFPLYLLTGICFVLISPATWSWQFLLVQGLAFITFLHNLSIKTCGTLNGTSWSVALEMQFYIVMAFGLALWSKRNPLLLLLIAIAVAMGGRSIVWLLAEQHQWEIPARWFRSVQLPMVIDEFAFGIALAMVKRRPPLWITALAMLGIGAISQDIYWSTTDYWHHVEMVIFWRPSLAFSCALVLLLAISLPPIKKPNKLYQLGYYLGEISYGIYLWHLVVILSLQAFFPALSPLDLLFGTLAGTLPLAALSWHGIEKPFIRWGKKHPTKVVCEEASRIT
jgi:peptidoglycan/LPS O-acetylase OafA/YrhL